MGLYENALFTPPWFLLSNLFFLRQDLSQNVLIIKHFSCLVQCVLVSLTDYGHAIEA